MMHIFHNGSHFPSTWCARLSLTLLFFHITKKLLLYKFHLQFLDVIYDFLCKHECIFFLHKNIQQSQEQRMFFFFFYAAEKKGSFVCNLTYSGATLVRF